MEAGKSWELTIIHPDSYSFDDSETRVRQGIASETFRNVRALSIITNTKYLGLVARTRLL